MSGQFWLLSVTHDQVSVFLWTYPLLCVSGKYYYEAKVTDEGLCRVGWSTPKAKLDLGTDKEGYGFGGTGKKSFGRQFDSYGEVLYLEVLHVPLSVFMKTIIWDPTQF